MSIHIFGIRHHGPGSARSLRAALTDLQPDIVLVEGPPDANKLIPFLANSQMRPPVALLVYRPDQPQRAAFYPFAAFSPEWQAIHYALTQHIPVEFMDLPQKHQLLDQPDEPDHPPVRPDPLNLLAQAAGFDDGEEWWEYMVEHRLQGSNIFGSITQAMTAVRREIESETPADPRNLLREAFMRKRIRAARRKHGRIAVVCGAWHAPALVEMPTAKVDNQLLKNLPRVLVKSTWVPWTFGRLAYHSGYGAGIQSPGWYHHLWTSTQQEHSSSSQIAIAWLTRVARLLRDEDLEASSASVIEAVRLAETLAALRERPLAGLVELNEASQTVFCFGRESPMQLIWDKLIVGERLGSVPDDTPAVPLQQDLQKEQRRLRLKPKAVEELIDLDLRQSNHLEKSCLLHRLTLLNVPWGQLQKQGPVRGKGTFHEFWNLTWRPELAVNLIEASLWGNTIASAAANWAIDAAEKAADLPTLSALVNQVMLADLPQAIQHLMTHLQVRAAVAGDVAHLMEALPPLVRVLRYGNVRQTDTEMVQQVVNQLVPRICIGLPGACASLDDEAAKAMLKRVEQVNRNLAVIQNEEHLQMWHEVLDRLVQQAGLHGLLAGRACRILLDNGIHQAADAAQVMDLALNGVRGGGVEPARAAAWVEGFLSGSGLLLLHDHALWQVLDNWVSQLPVETFVLLLPLLRRTFATFAPAERRQIGEQIKHGQQRPGTDQDAAAFDQTQADKVLPLLAQLLGIHANGEESRPERKPYE